MPIYEYCCQDCSARFEKLMSFSRANEQPPCPGCSGGNTRKLLSTIAAVRSTDSSGGPPVTVGGGGGCAGCSGGNCGSCGH